MTGENPVSLLAQFVFINLFDYLKTGPNQFPEVIIFDIFLISRSKELK